MEIKSDHSPEIQVTQSNLVESLELGIAKMRVLLKEMKADPLFNEALDQVTSGSMTKPIAQESMYKSSYNLPVKKDMPSHNVRVKLQQEDGESSDD